MQVKKFEASTVQEALELVKRELGPEAVILQTRKIRKGLGLSKSLIEVTAAVSERSLNNKQRVESRLPDKKKEYVRQLPAEKQASLINKYADRQVERAEKVREKVEMSQQTESQGQNQPQGRRITATRYADIIDEPRAEPVAAVPAAPRVSVPAAAAPAYSLDIEVQNLKKMVEDLKKTQMGAATFGETKGENSVLQEAFEHLVLNGVERRYAWPLVKQASFDAKPTDQRQLTDRIAESMLGGLIVRDPLKDILGKRKEGSKGPVAITLVGATGVGKTTTLAKMASLLSAKRGMKVGFINLDHDRVGAFEQIGTYAKIFNVPFRSAYSQSDLNAALMDFQNLDVVLIDVSGYSPKNTDSLTQLSQLLAPIPALHIYLVLSATTRDSELYNMISRFSIFHPQGLIVSKLDEAVTYGALYNIVQSSKMPLVYFGTGQRVPDDLEDATGERVVSLILDF